MAVDVTVRMEIAMVLTGWMWALVKCFLVIISKGPQRACLHQGLGVPVSTDAATRELFLGNLFLNLKRVALCYIQIQFLSNSQNKDILGFGYKFKFAKGLIDL